MTIISLKISESKIEVKILRPMSSSGALILDTGSLDPYVKPFVNNLGMKMKIVP